MDAKDVDRPPRLAPETAAAYERREDESMGLLVPKPNMLADVEKEPGSPMVMDVEKPDGDPIPLELKCCPLRPDKLRLKLFGVAPRPNDMLLRLSGLLRPSNEKPPPLVKEMPVMAP